MTEHDLKGLSPRELVDLILYASRNGGEVPLRRALSVIKGNRMRQLIAESERQEKVAKKAWDDYFSALKQAHGMDFSPEGGVDPILVARKVIGLRKKADAEDRKHEKLLKRIEEAAE